MQTTLSTWDKSFSLILGNEGTGDRPWEGIISEVYITDRALSKDEIAQAYSDKLRDHSFSSSLLAWCKISMSWGIFWAAKNSIRLFVKSP